MYKKSIENFDVELTLKGKSHTFSQILQQLTEGVPFSIALFSSPYPELYKLYSNLFEV